MSTLEAGVASSTAKAAEAVDEGTVVDSLRAVVVEVLSFEAGSRKAIPSEGGGGVFNGSSISIGVTKTLSLKSEPFSFLFESTAADEAPLCSP